MMAESQDLNSKGNQLADSVEGVSDAEFREMIFDLIGVTLDVIGIVDPTPIGQAGAGAVGAALDLYRGNYWDSLLDGASAFPYLGRLAKLGKLSKAVRVVDRAVQLARQSPELARVLRPVFARLDQVLSRLPDNVPGDLGRLRASVRQFINTNGVAKLAVKLVDVSSRFKFREVKAADGSLVREASMRLGVPGKVVLHPKKISSSTGDDIGHFIGERFGPPDLPGNYGPQNWMQNQFGTWKQMENRWAEKLQSGSDIEVTVQEFTRPGETRPWKREVQWKETSPNGSVSEESMTFLNTHSPKSRERQGIPSTVPPDHPGATILRPRFRGQPPFAFWY